MTPPASLVHKTTVVKAVVTSQAGKTVRFLDGKTIGGKAEFRANEFGRWPDGTILECHFRESDSKRSLLFCRELKANEALSTEEEQEPEVAVDLLSIVPKIFDDYYFNDEMRMVFGAVSLAMDAGEIVNVQTQGPSGYGKTSAWEAFASWKEMSFLRVDCAKTLDPEQWFGYQEARDGNTLFIPTTFTEMVEQGNAVIVLDEANRVEPWLHNTLFPILDHARQTEIHGRKIKVSPKVVFALTVNEGFQYAGTHTMDRAFKNRVDLYLEVGPLEKSIEVELLIKEFGLHYDVSERIVSMAITLRGIVSKEGLDADVSTRTSLKVGRWVKKGMRLKDAFKYVLSLSIAGQDRKPIIDAINSYLS